MGIVNHAVNGTEEYAKAAKLENRIMTQTDDFISRTLSKIKPVELVSTINKGETATEKNEIYCVDNKVAVIPKGFTLSGIDNETSINSGLVIYDLKGDTIDNWNDNKDLIQQNYNQFVWIPVDIDETDSETNVKALHISDWVNNERTEFTKPYTEPFSGAAQWELNDYSNIIKSVYLNGGFYIGRYETGTTVARNKTSGTTDVVIKRDAFPYNYVSWSKTMTNYEPTISFSKQGGGGSWSVGRGAVYLSKNLYNEALSYGAVSTLCYGMEWDAILDFLKNEYDVTSSLNYGNHKTNSFDITRGKYSEDNGGTFTSVTGVYNKPSSTPVLLTTGASDSFKQKNIYDMTGNLAEFTMECLYTAYGDTRIGRGGALYSTDDFGQAALSYRQMSEYDVEISAFYSFGFRVALYINTAD